MTDASGLRVRPARPAEAAALTALCRRSKAPWGYDVDFMTRAAETLVVTRAMIGTGRVQVAEKALGRVPGVAAIEPLPEPGRFDLALLFVDPPAIGSGAGRALFAAAVRLAQAQGGTRLAILADPFAEAFYRRMGAVRVRIGDAPSDAIPGRRLPLLEFTVVVGGDRQAS